MTHIFIPILIILIFSFSISAQDERIHDKNDIAWFMYTGNFKLNQKFSIHTEFQFRRTNWLSDSQQNLYRTGLVYSLHKDATVSLGYAFAHTEDYGDYPPQFAFPERRIFQQLILKNNISKLQINHRFTLEQRFLGKVSLINNEEAINYFFLNRIRYRLRVELPIFQSGTEPSMWSIAVQDEVFIGWGENLGINVFDQNRIGIFLNCKLGPSLKLEAGYINQYIQQGRKVNQSTIFQNNSGAILAMNWNFDLSRKD